MSKPREIEIGKRKIGSDEFVAICEGKNVTVTLNQASMAALADHANKRFPEFDLLQYRSEVEMAGRMVPFQVRGTILMTLLSILQDRLHIRPQLVQALVDMLNLNVLPELPALNEANDKQIMTDLLDSIDSATPKFVTDLTTIPPSPNNNESRRILQLRAPTQSAFIISAYKLQQIMPLLDISVALALEVTGLSTEPFSIQHHDQAHPHQEAMQTCNVIRNIINASQFTNKYTDKLKDNKDNDAILNALVVPESFSEVPDLHGVVKQSIGELFKVSRKEIISGDAVSQADDVYAAIQSLSYVHFHSQHVIDVAITYLQTVYNRIQYVMMNATLFGIELSDVDLEDDQQELLQQKLLADGSRFTNGLHLVESLTNTNELVSFLTQITEKIREAVVFEQTFYLHILQIKTVKYIEQQQKQQEAKQAALLKRVEEMRAAGKEQQAQKILDAQAKNKEKEVLKTALPLGMGSAAFYNGVMSYINTNPEMVTEKLPFSIMLSVVSSLIDSCEPSFMMMIGNVVNVTTSNDVKMPKGTRDITQEQMVFREKAFDMITKTFKQHGAGAIDTPVFERREILTGKYGEDSKLIYDLADQGGELLSLRYDLTVPFARFCATNGISNIKRYHIGKVYRRDQPVMTKGRFREFYQCDFDIAGEGSPMCNDSEVISSMIRILKALPLGNFKIKLSHRCLLDAIMTVCGVPKDKLRPICSAIDKLDKEPWSAVRDEMVLEKGLDGAVADKLEKYVTMAAGSIKELLPVLQKDEALATNADAAKAFKDMELLDLYMTALNVIDYVSFDLSLARGLDYYTGVIFEAVLLAEGENSTISVGSIGAGGRYDKLVGMFSGKDVPAVGASIGLERILTILEQRERAKAEQKNKKLRTSYTQVLVASNSAGNKDNKYNLLIERIKLVGLLRDVGINAEYLATEDPNIRKQVMFAEDHSIPIIVWIGVDELDNGKVSVKVLKENADDSEKPAEMQREEMVKYVKQQLAGLNDLSF